MLTNSADVVSLHQIYYRPEQVKLLDAASTPYDNSAYTAHTQSEFDIFRRVFHAGALDGDITGYLSWKFTEKSCVTVGEFKRFVEDNPGFDVYFINPFPELIAWKNVWIQSIRHHPTLLPIAAEIFRSVHPGILLTEETHGHDVLSYCNYWAGSGEFWKDYMEFAEPIYDFIEHKASDDFRRAISGRADQIIKGDHRPFIFERVFSTFLNSAKPRRLAYRYPKEHLESEWGARAATLIEMLQERLNEDEQVRLRAELVKVLKFDRATPLLEKVGTRLRRSAQWQRLRAVLRR